MKLKIIVLSVLFAFATTNLFVVDSAQAQVKTNSSPVARYRIDVSRSKFMVHA